MLSVIKKNYYLNLLLLLYLGYMISWVFLKLVLPENGFMSELFSDTYGYTSLFSGIYGLSLSRKWGGFTSQMGRSVFFLSLGLLLQGFGQLVYSFYFLFLHVEVPYPSIGDIGFFGSIFAYILGVWNLGKVSGVKLSMKNTRKLVIPALVTIVLLGISYWLFLAEYDFSAGTPLLIFLDFGYPLGQALYISLAVMVLLMSGSVLGGTMKPKIVFIIFALFIQYLADFTFLYQFMNNTWTAGGVNDLIYLVAYFFMTLALISLDSTLFKYQITESR